MSLFDLSGRLAVATGARRGIGLALADALAGVTCALANEWAGRGVNVNAIAPGYIRTDNTQALQDDPERSAALLTRIPAGRWGRPEDLAGAAVSSRRTRRTTSTARCSPSTAAGSRAGAFAGTPS